MSSNWLQNYQQYSWQCSENVVLCISCRPWKYFISEWPKIPLDMSVNVTLFVTYLLCYLLSVKPATSVLIYIIFKYYKVTCFGAAVPLSDPSDSTYMLCRTRVCWWHSSAEAHSLMILKYYTFQNKCCAWWTTVYLIQRICVFISIVRK
jgi:hypothetical protein